MNHSIVSSGYCHSTGELLKSHALLSALPSEFMLQSSSSRSIQVNPGVPIEDLKVLIQEWPTIIAADSTIYCRLGKSVLQATFSKGRVDLHVFSAEKNADDLVQKLSEPFSKYKFENKDEGGVWVNFCFASSMGVSRNTQFIRCPEWADIQDNYSRNCRQEISGMMARKRPWSDGRLMIWHGEPGTGKTFGIRALLMAWRDIFNFVIVTDPEKLLESPAYYYEVASAPNMNSIPGEDSSDEDDEDVSTSKKKRLLFIIEDSANLISTESRKADGNKFSKLINITDGLIGQGREDIFLITFNEALEDIDPAIVRPGRCISKVEFGKLDELEIQGWAKKNGLLLPEEPLTSASLAELYQMKANANKQSPVTV